MAYPPQYHNRPQNINPRPPGGGNNAGGGGDNEIEDILKSSAKINLWKQDNNKKVIRSELLDGEALQTAKELKDLASSQLRKYYAPVVALKSRLNLDANKSITDSEIKAQMAGMKASSAYAAARKQPKAVTEFFTKAANSIENRDDFMVFAKHFEAVVAFHKIFPDKNQ